MSERVAALVGPTAVGKTQVSLELAERLNAEIVSVDSMQVYIGMDVGTAKASVEDQARVRHHLLDVRPPSHDLTVSEFQTLARDAISDIHGRGKLPLLVGGSGLYFRAVVDELEFPARSPEVRERLESEAESLGAEDLYARLVDLDPKAAGRIEPDNVRRTIRALEVIELTGRPFSENDAWDRFESIYDLRVAGLTLERADLYARIERRVDRMLASGLVEETKRLELGRTAQQALGYRQVLESDPATLRDDIVRATKRFARRQGSWFRSDPRIKWFEAGDEGLLDEVAGYLISAPSALP